MAATVVQTRPLRPYDRGRREMKEALYSICYHAARYQGFMLPREMQAIPLGEALHRAVEWKDEHARPRRFRALRRLYPDMACEMASTRPEDVRNWSAGRDWRAHGKRLRRGFNSGSAAVHSLQNQLAVDLQSPDWEPCIAQVDNPDFDPKRNSVRVYSDLALHRELDEELAHLLDPRSWDECSDLFEYTYEVIQRNGEYVEKPDPTPRGKSWAGLLYELADIGGQAVENILQIRFVVLRECTDTHSRPQKCRDEECDHPITRIVVNYRLHDSLSYQIGGVVYPGMMRRNHGYFLAKPGKSGNTELQCVKQVRFGRLTRWGGRGGFDFGEILNYAAATYLSLWIGDVQQIVPCCKKKKAAI